jgi:hypothetical protein
MKIFAILYQYTENVTLKKNRCVSQQTYSPSILLCFHINLLNSNTEYGQQHHTTFLYLIPITILTIASTTLS